MKPIYSCLRPAAFAVLVFLLGKSDSLFGQYTYDDSQLCTQVQGGNCLNAKSCFAIGQTINSWVRFTDITEPINIRHLWYNDAGTLVYQSGNIGICCATQVHVSAQTAAFLGIGNFTIDIQVALESDPNNYTSVAFKSFSVVPGTCGAPINLNSTGAGHTWISLEWGDLVNPEFGDRYKVEYREGSTGPWSFVFTSESLGALGPCSMFCFCVPAPPAQGITLFGLKPCTTYQFRVSRYCNCLGTYSAPTAILPVPTKECDNTVYFRATNPQTYAVGLQGCSGLASLDFANIQDYNNSCSVLDPEWGYEHYQSGVATVAQGQTYSLIPTVWGLSDFNLSVNIGAWIDWDQNGQFGTGEKVATENNITINNCEYYTPEYAVTIPLTAKTGLTRMRVIVQEGSAPSPHAGVINRAAVEDIDVKILSSAAFCYPAGSTLSNGIVLHYPFDGNTSDTSASNNPGLTGGNPAYALDRNNEAGLAIRLDGIDDSVRSSNAVAERSVAFWYRAEAAVQMPLFQGGLANGATGSGYLLAAYQAGGLPNTAFDSLPGLALDFTGIGVYIPFQQTFNGWHHLAVSWSGAGAGVQVAIDGVLYPGYLYATATGFASTRSAQPFQLASAPVPNAAAPTKIGTNSGQKFWNNGLARANARFDDLRVYNRALTSDELRLVGESYAIATPETFCTPQNTTLRCPIAAADSYEWRNLGTGAVIGIAATLTVSVPATAAFALKAVANGCTYRDTVTVTRLNPIAVSNLTANGLTGTFTVSGGQPEFDGSAYGSVTMALQGNPGVVATLTGASVGNGGTVGFTCPQAGVYDVTVGDAGGCVGSVVVTVTDLGSGGGNGIGCWKQQNPLPHNKDYNDIFTKGNFGWRVGDFGTIDQTSDMGINWNSQKINTTSNLYSIFF